MVSVWIVGFVVDRHGDGYREMGLVVDFAGVVFGEVLGIGLKVARMGSCVWCSMTWVLMVGLLVWLDEGVVVMDG